MSMFFSSSSGFAKSSHPKVAVVGAGLAGLTAAYRLKEIGLDVDLYEARSRVGGRVFTVNLSGVSAELGALNITDGGEAENMMRLINEMGLSTERVSYPLACHFSDGESRVSLEQLLKDRFADKEKLKEDLRKLKKVGWSMEDILNRLFEKKDALFTLIATILASYEGATIEKLSTKYVDTLFHLFSGGLCSVHREEVIDLVTIKGGNSLLPKKIAEKLGKNLHLNSPLVRIMKQEEGDYALTFQNNQTVRADLLILAIPCPVFKQIEFGDGVLEIDRLKAIRNIGYGATAKILLPFKGTPSEKINLIDSHGRIFSAYNNVLAAFHTGDRGMFSHDTISDHYTQVLPRLAIDFGELVFPEAKPSYAQDQNFVSYKTPVGHSWLNDPYAGGSYSYVAAGQETLLAETSKEDGEEVKKLFAPIEKRLYFVGEHTTILDEVRGTMEAACESGERCARMVAKSLY